MRTFTVDVDYSTHDLLKEGVTCQNWHRVTVSAIDEVDACLLAAQIVATTTGKMPTATYLHI